MTKGHHRGIAASVNRAYSTLGQRIPRVRKAYPDECADLGALALRSKAHWGYPDPFLERVNEELQVDFATVAAGQAFVIELADELIGFCALAIPGSPAEREAAGNRAAPATPAVIDTAELTHCFVAPEYLRQNFGRLLWNYALRELRQFYPQIRRLRIISDPHAAGFYRRCGARNDGFQPADHDPKRLLPRLIYTIAS